MMCTWSVTLTEHVEKCAVILINARKLTDDRPLFRPLCMYVCTYVFCGYNYFHSIPLQQAEDELNKPDLLDHIVFVLCPTEVDSTAW